MSEHKASIGWVKTSEDFSYENYNREHQWKFTGGEVVAASAAPSFSGDPACVDPEEAFVASLSSCHMLTFLAIASKKKLSIDSYEDDAVGFLEKNEDGKLAITRVILKPRITFSAGVEVSAEELSDMHDKAHHNCFIANSVVTDVTVE